MTPSIFDRRTEEHHHKIAGILTQYLFKGFSISDVLKMYDDLATPTENSSKNGIDPAFRYDKYGDRIIQVENINAQLQGKENIGIDLPVLFTTRESLSTLMLVAMEPRRKGTGQQCTIASPFGLWRPCQNKSGRKISEFIEQLRKNHYSVYVTDIGKVYALQGKRKYTGDPEVNKKIFEAELDLVQPSHVIAFGGSTFRLLSSICPPTIETLPLRHPAAWGGDKNYYQRFTGFVSKSASLTTWVNQRNK